MNTRTALMIAAFGIALAATPARADDGARWRPFGWLEAMGVEVLHCYPNQGKSWTSWHVIRAIETCRAEAALAKARRDGATAHDEGRAKAKPAAR